LGFAGFSVACDGDLVVPLIAADRRRLGLPAFTEGFFDFRWDACRPTASFARMTEAFAFWSTSCMLCPLAAYRSITFDSSASAFVNLLRALIAFMTTPASFGSAQVLGR
jgi:hypothetical protein